MKRFLPILVLSGLCCTVSAQTVTVSSDAAVQSDTQIQRDQARDDGLCLRETGSRLTRHSMRTSRATTRNDRRRDCAIGNGRAYSRDDIERTGAFELDDAIRRLDPRVF